ncbi:MAG: hypothetical protein GWN71_19565 [Gammaproteobacteria bacterium]|nr:hypothetical protein [Gemmatimonadota bacterium]NIR37795.1 hypothetical protein [Actinomycetota bacterium]NIU75686.1 hypothetical protein [Gammaproteobacteria bacterium]NIX21645.1 hypothetical protein [Actinomycetota bacterium]
MAESKREATGAKTPEVETGEGGPDAPVGTKKAAAVVAPKAKKGKVAVRAGGHVMYVDPPPPTPKRKPMCSVHGTECPGHEADGWRVED